MKKHTLSYQGVIVPMVTPLKASGSIDGASAEKLVRFLLDNETTPFILGTTGEAASIPLREREKLTGIMVNHKREGSPAIAGVMGLTVKDTVFQANKYLKKGIDSVVITLPYHFELTGRQKFDYFRHLAESIEGDIILYNIPKTVHQSIPLSVIDELSHFDNIIGIKDSEPDEKRLADSLTLWKDRADFFHFTGVNSLMLKGILLGSRGIIPSTANFMPRLYAEMYNCCQSGDTGSAEELFLQTVGWSKIYQQERTLGESIAALKFVMSGLGLCLPFVMRPLTIPDATEQEKIQAEFSKHQENPALFK